MKYSFCTYFDSNYACFGIALYNSLKEQCDNFELYVCCLDEKIYNILTKLHLDGIVPLRLSDIEEFDPEFAVSRNNRSLVEYYFTLSTILPRYIFARHPHIKLLTYLDSDLYFFSSPDPIFEEFGHASLSLIDHRFPPALKWREIYGKYNFAFQIYRNDNNTAKCLEWWRDKCIEWCYDRLEDDKFADQKYLEQWENLFDGVKHLYNKGINVAPWNWTESSIEISNSSLPLAEGKPLIFYHYQGVRILGKHFIFHNQGSYDMLMPKPMLKFFYYKYYKALQKAEQTLKSCSNFQELNMMSNTRRGGYGYGTLRAYLSAFKNNNLLYVPKTI